MNDAAAGRRLALQVACLALVAALPVAWLIGRRTATAPAPVPLLMQAGEEPIALVESRRGLAAGTSPVTLPDPAARAGAYRLLFVPVAAGEPPRPPYRIRLQGPRGGDLWAGMWEPAPGHRQALEIVLPARGLAGGRYAIVVEDAAGLTRSFPYLVPGG